MIIKEQILKPVGKPLKNYTIYFDVTNQEIIQERDGIRYLIAGKNEHYSLLRKIVSITQKYHKKYVKH